MKRCPECRKDYLDDSLLYCLDDGTALVQGTVGDEPATAILSGDAITGDDRTREFAGQRTAVGEPSSLRKFVDRRNVLLGAAAVLMVVIGAVGARYLLPKAVFSSSAPVVHFQIDAPPGTQSPRASRVSPDGRNIALVIHFGGRQQIFLRSLESSELVPLPGAEGDANGIVMGPPAWSPDSRSIFFGSKGKFRKLDIGGGGLQVLADIPKDIRSAIYSSWASDGTIYFSGGGKIYTLPSNGGEPTVLLSPDLEKQERSFDIPTILPDGRHLLVWIASSNPEVQGSWIVAVDGKRVKRVMNSAEHAVFAQTNEGPHLTFIRSGSIYAQAFDLSSFELTGKEKRIVEKVPTQGGSSAPPYSVSDSGVLSYYTPTDEARRFRWVDRSGKTLETFGRPAAYHRFSLAPDETRLAFGKSQEDAAGVRDLFVMDLTRGSELKLTFDPGDDRDPRWSPDGKYVTWRARRNGKFQILRKLASGMGDEELLLESDSPVYGQSWSPDGRLLIYELTNTDTREDLFVLPLDGDRKPYPYIQTRFDEYGARFSPDGRYVAYFSDESNAIFVQTFPASGEKWQVSVEAAGGGHPEWRADGREIYYGSAGGLMAVEVSFSGGFKAGIPQQLFTWESVASAASIAFIPNRDGSKFLIGVDEQTLDNRYSVLVNWPELLKR
jgi:eukaryotic-like serine/threonine-protein kinase